MKEPPSALRRRPSVSVVVCAYNAEDWIGQAIESVLTQTCGSGLLEIILVDSGSIDGTVTKAQATVSQCNIPFRVLVTPNEGPSRARNVGWQCSTGDWIQFLDSDDFLGAGKIELQLKATVPLNPEVAIVYSDWRRVRQHGGVWEADGTIQSPKVGADALADLLRSDNFVHLGSQLIRRTWLKRVSGFDERHWLIEDVDLLLRLAMSGAKFEHVRSDGPMFFYRQRRGSLSRRNERDFVDGCLRNARMVEAHWRSAGEVMPQRREVLVEIYLQVARYYASRDADQFDAVTTAIELLIPGFVPRFPRRLRYASRLLGYRRAEGLATLYRSIRAR